MVERGADWQQRPLPPAEAARRQRNSSRRDQRSDREDAYDISSVALAHLALAHAATVRPPFDGLFYAAAVTVIRSCSWPLHGNLAANVPVSPRLRGQMCRIYGIAANACMELLRPERPVRV